MDTSATARKQSVMRLCRMITHGRTEPTATTGSTRPNSVSCNWQLDGGSAVLADIGLLRRLTTSGKEQT